MSRLATPPIAPTPPIHQSTKREPRMATSVQTELRLIAVIKEARELMAKLKQQNISLATAAQNAPKKSSERKEAVEIRDEVLACITKLKEGIQEATIVGERIGKHEAWMYAVREVFGNEGLAKCKAYMKEKQKQAKDSLATVAAPSEASTPLAKTQDSVQ